MLWKWQGYPDSWTTPSCYWNKTSFIMNSKSNICHYNMCTLLFFDLHSWNVLCPINIVYHTAQNFSRRKLWQSWNYKKIGGENFYRLAMNCQIHQSLVVGWRIKLWRIGNDPPNPPKFSPAKSTKVFSRQSFVLYGTFFFVWCIIECIQASRAHVFN